MKTMTDLYEAQKTLDALIVVKRGLEGKDLLHDKVLALNESLGKLASAWRGHHYWAEDRERVGVVEVGACKHCYGTGTNPDMGAKLGDCPKCYGEQEIIKDPLLEAYAECLSRILSIANTLGAKDDDLYTYEDSLEGTEVNQVTEMIYLAARIGVTSDEESIALCFKTLLYVFANFGEQSLGFDFDKYAVALLMYLDAERERLERGVTA